MKQKMIEIDVFPDGNVNMEGQNFVGAECDTIMRPFESLFSVFKKKNKGDRFVQKRVTNQRQRGS